VRNFNNNDCTNPLYNEHIMLLYEDKDKCNNIIIDYINEGLKNGCLCVYASVDLDNSKGISLMESLSSKIINYEENIKNENLKFINFKPYYETALRGDLTLFENLKTKLEDILYKRITEGKKDKMLAFADAACRLSETRNFNECIVLEKWWQDANLDWSRNNKNITVVCPHPNYVFKEESVHKEIKNKISGFHDTKIDIEDEHYLQYFYKLINQNRQIRILIAESESDLRSVYKEYLNEYLKNMGFEVIVVESGSKCIEYLLDSKGKGREFDMVILDSHLPDIKGIDVIKNIRKEIPNQRIVFTTTYSFSEIKNIINSFGIDKNDILLKPFYFTKLLSIINPLVTIK
jgi:CheY-like chemotaxis protein